MENFKIAINAVLPLFFTMAVGYFLRQIHFVDEPLLKKLNKLVFNVFLPLLLFINIYQSDLETSFRLKTILTAVCSVLALFVVLCAVVPLIEKDGRRRGVIVQGIFRSNYILFGAPLVFGVFGDQGMGTVSVISAFVVPLYNMLSVAALETFSQGQVNVKKILKGIVKNPLIIASALGILCLVASVPLPQAVEKTVSDLGKVATPLGLVSLGGFFKFSDTKRFIKQLVIIVTGRLILCPAAFLPIFIKMGFRDVELMALATMMGAPIAVSSFIMAQQQGADADLAGQSVAFTTLFSVFTMFLIIFGLKQMRFI
ncbi:MAG: AEC family transporter [Clostridiaceae bacterium]|jgi:predicted permease|nr:AEC family transporter [Clostridiaceae bacterium]